jgi:esterase FrsA
MPEIMLWTLRRTVGATSTVGLTRKLRALSVRHLYPRIDVPVLAINGDRDTLISTRDTVDLAHGAPTATLLLYPDDDHCAMGHYSEWLRATQEWLQTTLAQGDRRLISSPPAPGRPTS